MPGLDVVPDVAAPTPFLSVIVPAYNCPGVLRQSLEALRASDLPRERWELIVVDDGSTDDTARLASTLADRVLSTTNGPCGPGTARNVGASAARGDVVVFIDADVLVAPTVLSQFAEIFAGQPDVAAAFGAYDQQPGHESFLSQYRNLLHHYVHTESAGDATTFWAGCGAVRRDIFLAVGGFDAQRYPRPQIEDIELGYRLHDRGHRILLAPQVQGKHLKRWTFVNMVRTDLRDRAIPWMHLIIDRTETAADGPLNLQRKEKALAITNGLGMLALLAAALTADARWLFVTLTAILIVAVGNAGLLRWFARIRGAAFALAVVPLRSLFYSISALGAAWALVSHRFLPVPTIPPPLRDRGDRVAASR